MKHTEHQLISAGYQLGKTKTADEARDKIDHIRAMIALEAPEDQETARYLVGQGQKEARQ